MRRISVVSALLLCCLWGRVTASEGAIKLIETKPFRVLQGVVRGEQEQPLAGVRLQVFARASMKDEVVSATPVAELYSNADGSFYFAHLPEGAYELRASMPGDGWNVTRLYLKIQPANERAKTRPIILPLTLKD